MLGLDPFVWFVIGAFSLFGIVLGTTAWFTRGK